MSLKKGGVAGEAPAEGAGVNEEQKRRIAAEGETSPSFYFLLANRKKTQYIKAKKFADVIQRQYGSFPSFTRGFDSRHPLFLKFPGLAADCPLSGKRVPDE